MPFVPKEAPDRVQKKGGAPDLRVTRVTVNRPVVRSQFKLKARVTIENQGGDMTGAAGIGVRPRLSKTATPTAQDAVGGIKTSFRAFPKLGPGEQKTKSLSFTPKDLGWLQGKAWVGADVDFLGKHAESNESNNTGYATDQVNILDRYGNGGNTDPRLGWTDKAKADAEALDNTSLPFKSATPGAGWDGKEILGKLTQVDGYKDLATAGYRHTDSDEFRCGPTTVMASSVLAGPGAVGRLCDRVMPMGITALNGAQAQMQQGRRGATERFNELAKSVISLWLVKFKLDTAQATYGDLSIMGHALKVIVTGSAAAATKVGHMGTLAEASGKSLQIRQPVGDKKAMETYLDTLQPGECYHVLVDSDRRPANAPVPHTKEQNHWVTIICEAGSDPKNPTILLYDPYPKDGPQYRYRDKSGFWTFFTEADGTWRGATIECKTRPSA